MQRLILFVGLAFPPPATAGPGGPCLAGDPSPACELLSMAEVAGFLRVAAVQVDSLNSGMNDLANVDVCSWFVHAGESQAPAARSSSVTARTW